MDSAVIDKPQSKLSLFFSFARPRHINGICCGRWLSPRGINQGWCDLWLAIGCTDSARKPV